MPPPHLLSLFRSQAYTHPRIIYSVHQACIRSRSCQTSSLLRPTPPPSRPSALSQRMSSEKQTRATQVSLCGNQKELQCFMSLCPSRCSDGHGPCNPCPLHPVSKRPLVQLFTIYTSSTSLKPDFSMPIQRTQSGSTVIVSCFPTGMFSSAIHEIRTLIYSLPVTRTFT